MTTATLVIGGGVLLAMICVSGYGAITLPRDARVPIHLGISYNNYVPKRIGLVIHPAAGALVFLLFALVSPANASSKALPHVLPVIILCVLLAVQAGAIWVARRRSVV